MTEDKMFEIMRERDFILLNKTFSATDVIYGFVYQNSNKYKVGKYDVPSYYCKIRASDYNFRFYYFVPTSFEKLSTDWCSPLDSDKQFDSIASKFEAHITILEHHFSRK